MKRIDLRRPTISNNYYCSAIAYRLKLLLEYQHDRSQFSKIAAHVMYGSDFENLYPERIEDFDLEENKAYIKESIVKLLFDYYPSIHQRFIALYPEAAKTREDWFPPAKEVEKILAESDLQQIESEFISRTGYYICDEYAFSMHENEIIPLMLEDMQLTGIDRVPASAPMSLRLKQAVYLALEEQYPYIYYKIRRMYLEPLVSKTRKIEREYDYCSVMYLKDGTGIPFFALKNAGKTIKDIKIHISVYEHIEWLTGNLATLLSSPKAIQTLKQGKSVCWSLTKLEEQKYKLIQYLDNGAKDGEKTISVDINLSENCLNDRFILEFDGLYLKTIEDEETSLMRTVRAQIRSQQSV